ncbi:LOW QUALITY PROTEIN: alanine aminotransferase 1-like [Trachemys scripta elegans]|uniref:LOW QUALITY PROTEIN: alanine aminotransferase 1-like n=1 Tax=Trachemys scripta elegans TaxID=31138 RepID=UPI0015575213|nr:LOW QUALITY PROTEIN: alanine aminotransferase 1-like [Trachemys scripta elegans]
MAAGRKVLTLDSVNPCVKGARLPTLGPLLERASEIQRQLVQGEEKPFREVIWCHSGDPHAAGQRPITFLRQVAAICAYPELLHADSMPRDAKQRASRILQELHSSSAGAYNMEYVTTAVPQRVARYLERRDGGIRCDPRNIVMCGGITTAIVDFLSLVVNEQDPRRAGVLLPVPGHPLFADAVALAGAVGVQYHLDEEGGWALDVGEIRRVLGQARGHCTPKVLCVINPGYPTGESERAAPAQPHPHQLSSSVPRDAGSQRLTLPWAPQGTRPWGLLGSSCNCCTMAPRRQGPGSPSTAPPRRRAQWGQGQEHGAGDHSRGRAQGSRCTDALWGRTELGEQDTAAASDTGPWRREDPVPRPALPRPGDPTLCQGAPGSRPPPGSLWDEARIKGTRRPLTHSACAAGHVLSRRHMQDVLQLAAQERLLLLADEVHQDCVFTPDAPFLSFKRVLCELGPAVSSAVQLISFYSVSKGFAAEGGFRAGFFELVNIDPAIMKRFCSWGMSVYPLILGQVLLDALMEPPLPGEPSCRTFMAEKQAVLSDLAHKAQLTQEIFSQVPGIRCNPVQGTMYSFPRIQIPARAVQEAQALGLEPDFFFCQKLLEATGIVLAPGSTFGQRRGTHHVSTGRGASSLHGLCHSRFLACISQLGAVDLDLTQGEILRPARHGESDLVALQLRDPGAVSVMVPQLQRAEDKSERLRLGGTGELAAGRMTL